MRSLQTRLYRLSAVNWQQSLAKRKKIRPAESNRNLFVTLFLTNTKKLLCVKASSSSKKTLSWKLNKRLPPKTKHLISKHFVFTYIQIDITYFFSKWNGVTCCMSETSILNLKCDIHAGFQNSLLGEMAELIRVLPRPACWLQFGRADP